MKSIFLGVIGPQEIIIILIIVLLLFGGKKIPELMRGLGSGVKEFKNASKGEDDNEIKDKPNT
ncbi:MAG: twin-arginine translocase TatA/TatE family subunit [Solirubrobacteraceae bacterium]